MLRFSWLLLLLPLLLGGCLSSAAGPDMGGGGPDKIDLVALSQLDPTGPDVQDVRLRATGSTSSPVSFAGLVVWALTAGEPVHVEPLAVHEVALETGAAEADVTLDVGRLRELDATGVRFVLGPAVLDVPWAAGAPEPEPQPGESPEEPEEQEGQEPGEGSGEDPEQDPGEVPGEEPGDETGGQEPGPGQGPEPEPGTPGRTVTVRTLRPDTSEATDVYIIRAAQPGPTVMIVGGVHGDETSGWLAAGEIKDWDIDAGTLVVLPRANADAVRRGRRTGANGLDLNRQFPVGSAPKTALAREIWAIVEEFSPEALLDLHEGWGIYGRHDSVGQTLITYDAGDAHRFAAAATGYLNRHHVNDRRTYSFRVVGPPVAGSLTRKAGAELGIPAFIAEATAYKTLQSTRIRWQKAFAEEFLRWYGLILREERIVPEQYRAAGDGPELGLVA